LGGDAAWQENGQYFRRPVREESVGLEGEK
jgi:hypothetical protein